MKKKILLLTATALCVSLFAGCSKGEEATTSPTPDASPQALSGTVKLSGSTSMESLAKAEGEAFAAVNTGVSVDVQLGGSGAAVTNVKDGISDIGNLSRALKEEEKTNGFTEYTVAIDGISIVLNPKNTVSDLTMEQISQIFKGEITNWSEVGGTDGEIVVVGREAGSGTRDGFEEITKTKEQTKYKAELNETGQVKNMVATTDGAVGYISMGYVDETVKAIKVAGIEGSELTVSDNTYPIQRPFLMITAGNEAPHVKSFLDFMLSDEGQAIVTKKGYITVK